MSDSDNGLLQKVQNMQPLFKTEEKHEEAFKTQNVFKEQFEQQQQFKTKQTEAVKETHEEQLANSFKVEEAEKIKEDADAPQEPVPEFISLNYSGITVTTADDKKMQVIKRAVDYYQMSKGDKEEGAALQTVIKACNSFTWGKFSLFSFGKSKVKLNEVKKLREEAQKALAAFEKKEKEKNNGQLKTDYSVFAPEIKEYVYDRNVDYPDEVTEADKEKQIKERAKDIQKRYHFTAERAQKVARDEFDKHEKQLSNENFKDFYLTKEERLFMEVEEEVESRLNDMSSVKRFFTNLFGKMELKNKVMQDKIKKMKFAFDLNLAQKADTRFSKNDSDYENTFI